MYRVEDRFTLVDSIIPECSRDIVFYSLNETSAGPVLIYLQGCTCRQFVAHVVPIDQLQDHARATVSYRLRGWVMVSVLIVMRHLSA